MTFWPAQRAGLFLSPAIDERGMGRNATETAHFMIKRDTNCHVAAIRLLPPRGTIAASKHEP